MTRADQKLSERRTLDAILDALGVRLAQEPQPGEAPDFIVRLPEGSVGIEITMYCSGEAVEGGMERRKVENEWDQLAHAANASAANISTFATSMWD